MKTTLALLVSMSAVAGCTQQEGDLTDTAEQDVTSCQTTIDLRTKSTTQIIDADEYNGANCPTYQVTALTSDRQWKVRAIWYGEPLGDQTTCEDAVLAGNLKVQTSTGWTSIGSLVDRGVWYATGAYSTTTGAFYACAAPEVEFGFGSNHTFLLTADARDIGTGAYQGMQFVIAPQ